MNGTARDSDLGLRGAVMHTGQSPEQNFQGFAGDTRSFGAVASTGTTVGHRLSSLRQSDVGTDCRHWGLIRLTIISALQAAGKMLLWRLCPSFGRPRLDKKSWEVYGD